MTANYTVETAHEYGRGMSATERAAISRRVFAQMSNADVQAMLMQAARRFIHEMLRECLPDTWLRRAESYELVGTRTADATAMACRRKAWLIAAAGLPDEITAEIDEILDIAFGEVA